MTGSGARALSPIDQLIVAVATGATQPGEGDLHNIVHHVAQVGFDPNRLERARGDIAGLLWRAHVIGGTDLLPPAERHYLRHVVKQQEWPPATTLPDYLASVRALILNADAGIYTSAYGPSAATAQWQLGIVGRSGPFQGPQGFSWTLVEYRVALGHWVTAYQVPHLPGVLVEPQRWNLQWIRQPK
jgi:hypothetical protein